MSTTIAQFVSGVKFKDVHLKQRLQLIRLGHTSSGLQAQDALKMF